MINLNLLLVKNLEVFVPILCFQEQMKNKKYHYYFRKTGGRKSIISANIAISYAQAGFKTLIIDGDMRKPTQQYDFETANYDGLSNLIIGKSDFDKAIRSTRVENLDLLTSGPVPPNPSELVASDRFKEIYNQLMDMYDFILIDTPPVTSVTDASIFTAR